MLQSQFIVFCSAHRMPSSSTYLSKPDIKGLSGFLLNPHPTAHQSISFQWISLMLILTLPRHFPCNYLNWDFIISCTDYCLSLLLCLPCWGTILLNNANLPMPLSFKILLWLSTASGRNLKSLAQHMTSHDLASNSFLLTAHMPCLLSLYLCQSLTCHCPLSPGRFSLFLKTQLRHHFLLTFSKSGFSAFPLCSRGALDLPLLWHLLYCNHQFKYLFFLLHYQPFLGNNLSAFTCNSQNIAQCLARGQT